MVKYDTNLQRKLKKLLNIIENACYLPVGCQIVVRFLKKSVNSVLNKLYFCGTSKREAILCFWSLGIHISKYNK